MERYREARYEKEQRSWIFYFLIGFFCGIFLCLFEERTNGIGTVEFLELLLWRMENYELQLQEYFMYLLERRLVLWFGLTIIATTYLGIWVLKGFIVWCGAAFGNLLTVYFVRFGAKGIGYVFCLLFPQMLCYVPAYLLLCSMLAGIYDKIYHAKQWEGYVVREKKYSRVRKIGCFFSLLLVAIIGVILECYVNPMLVNKLKNIF